MKTKFIEALHSDQRGNWGKFMVARFDEEEWRRLPQAPGVKDGDYGHVPLLSHIGQGHTHIMVFDLQTNEGAIFRPDGFVKADLDKHSIWVCPMYEPFLNWLYKQDLSDLDALPAFVEFTKEEAKFSMTGYRRPGKHE